MRGSQRSRVVPAARRQRQLPGLPGFDRGDVSGQLHDVGAAVCAEERDAVVVGDNVVVGADQHAVQRSDP